MHPRNEFSLQRFHQIQLASSFAATGCGVESGSHHAIALSGWWEVFSILWIPFINILRLTRSCHGISFLVIVLRCATFLFLLLVSTLQLHSSIAV